MSTLFSPLALSHGPAWKNRFTLAPLTNGQALPGGLLSDTEYRWLTMRAQGGFALTMTCASHVQAIGQGFPGQLGCFGDQHIEGLARLADGIRSAGSVSSVQLHHAGIRAPKDLIGEQPVGPSDDEETRARALSTLEVEQLVEDFVLAAQRVDKAGFDGVQIHGAHSYIVCAFLSPQYNRREDQYGDRPRLLMDIIQGIRERCRPDFQLGVRLSPENYGLDPQEMLDLAGQLLVDDRLDYLDMSLWDVFKGDLLAAYTALPRSNVKLGVAGKLYSGEDVERALSGGADFVTIGKAAILHHDWPEVIRANPVARMVELPISRDHLRNEGLGESFINYLSGWKGFISD